MEQPVPGVVLGLCVSLEVLLSLPRNIPSGAIGAIPCRASSASSFFKSSSLVDLSDRAEDGIGDTMATLGLGDMSPRRLCLGKVEVLCEGDSWLTPVFSDSSLPPGSGS